MKRLWEKQIPVWLKLDDIHQRIVLDRIHEFGGNKERAAQSLGVTVRTVYNWLHKWGRSDLITGRWAEEHKHG